MKPFMCTMKLVLHWTRVLTGEQQVMLQINANSTCSSFGLYVLHSRWINVHITWQGSARCRKADTRSFGTVLSPSCAYNSETKGWPSTLCYITVILFYRKNEHSWIFLRFSSWQSQYYKTRIFRVPFISRPCRRLENENNGSRIFEISAYTILVYYLVQQAKMSKLRAPT